MKLNIKPINQQSDEWLGVNLGYSNIPINSDGCLLCNLVEFFNFISRKTKYTPVTLTDEFKAKGVYSGALVSWNGFKRAYPPVSFEWLSVGDFNKVVRDRLNKGLPSIACVKMRVGFHFVHVKGYNDEDNSIKGLIINDPWAGEEYFFGAKYPKIQSLRLLTPQVILDHSSDEEKVLSVWNELSLQLRKISDMGEKIKGIVTKLDGLLKSS